MRPFPSGSSATLKGAQDWLTEADGAVERLLSERLAAACPDDGFRCEEGGVYATMAGSSLCRPMSRRLSLPGRFRV